jgi:hypothetical protein
MGRPEGCNPQDDDLLEHVRSNKCLCKEPKTPHSTFCRKCYIEIPFELRIELWKPWNAGFAEVYNGCIQYLAIHTTRFSKSKKDTPKSTKKSKVDKVKPKENKVVDNMLYFSWLGGLP